MVKAATKALVTLAGMLAEELRRADLGAGAVEWDMAVRVVNPDTGGVTTVWLPDDRLDEYVWGPQFQWTAPGELVMSELVAMIKATAGAW